MITEDYVSFETAKLLKEKGFDEYGMYFYTLKDEGREGYKSNDLIEEFAHNSHPELKERAVSCPTIQMAMKWLRNIHDIVCSVDLFIDSPEIPPYWSFNILNQSTANVMYEAFDIKCETYEQACESAIKYCLENLI